MGLFDMVMIKDNHISAAGGIVNAIRSVDEYLKQNSLQLDVEVKLQPFHFGNVLQWPINEERNFCWL